MYAYHFGFHEKRNGLSLLSSNIRLLRHIHFEANHDNRIQHSNVESALLSYTYIHMHNILSLSIRHSKDEATLPYNDFHMILRAHFFFFIFLLAKLPLPLPQSHTVVVPLPLVFKRNENAIGSGRVNAYIQQQQKPSSLSLLCYTASCRSTLTSST